MDTIRTTIHAYRFDTRDEAQKAEYAALKARLVARGSRVMESWGGKGHYAFVEGISGQPVQLETAHLFDNQWNTAPIEGFSETGLRVFDWAQDYPIDFSKYIKRGHYLEITDEMREIRRNTMKCGYCGKQEPAAKGYVFCPHCLDSAYLQEGDLKLTRLRYIDRSGPGVEFAELTEAEKAHLLPLFREAQLRGGSTRSAKRNEKLRADVEAKFKKKTEAAKREYEGFRWLLDNGMNTENVIYYDHTGRFGFGWRKPLSAGELSGLLDVISEFPGAYDIKVDDGRTLSGD